MAALLAGLMLVSQLLPGSTESPPDPRVDAETVEVDQGAIPEEDAQHSDLEHPPSTPYNYLYASYPSLARRMDCLIQAESRWDPSAYNRRSGAAGLLQFLLGTWNSTPQGKAGASRYDPYAAIDGAAWIITTDRKSWNHWTPILFGMC